MLPVRPVLLNVLAAVLTLVVVAHPAVSALRPLTAAQSGSNGPATILLPAPGSAARLPASHRRVQVEVARRTTGGHVPEYQDTVDALHGHAIQVDAGSYDIFAQEVHSGIIVRLNPTPVVLTDGSAKQVASPGSAGFRSIARDRRSAWQAKVEAQLARYPTAPYVDGDVLVRFRPGTPISAVSGSLDAVGGTIVSRISGIHVYRVALDNASVFTAIDALSRNADVEFAEPNGMRQLAGITPNDASYPQQQSYLQAIGLEDAWAAFDLDGDGSLSTTEALSGDVVLAIVDSGVDGSHPDLAGNIWTNTPEFTGVEGVDDDGNGKIDDTFGWDFYDWDGDASDINGHGTHVAGIAAAMTGNGIGIAGVSWQSRIMPLKVGGSADSFPVDASSEAIIYAADQGADVINMSFGGFTSGASAFTERLAVSYAAAQGAILVAASGNEDLDTSGRRYFPANLGNTISVGASDGFARAWFSNYGADLDLVAPGVGILSTVIGGDYEAWNGTSMATPVVAGIAAMLRGLDPVLTSDGIRSILHSTADKIGPLPYDASGRNDEFGYGRVNAAKAVAELIDTPVVAVDTASVVEPDVGAITVTLTVSLSHPTSAPLSVEYGASQHTALHDEDYELSGGTLTFAPGEVAKSLDVSVLGDTTDEPDEMFALWLKDPETGETLASGSVTILDNDDPAAVSISDVTVVEGDTGAVNAVFVVTLHPASGHTVTVAYAAEDGTASLGADYAATQGVLTFAPGDVARSITVPINGDGQDETNEEYFVFLSDPSNAVISDAMGAGVVIDDDGPSVALSMATDLLAENDGTAATTVTLSAVSAQDVFVTLTLNGTAIQGVDYIVSGTAYDEAASILRIPSGDPSGSIIFTAVDDPVFEGSVGETIDIGITEVSNGEEGTPAQLMVTLIDDEPLPVISLAVVPHAAEVAEGGGTATISYTTTPNSAVPISVVLELSGDAERNVDYLFSDGALTAIDDVLVEGDETVIVTLGEISIGTASETENEIAVTILDDDILSDTSLTVNVDDGSNPIDGARVRVFESDVVTPATVEDASPDKLTVGGAATFEGLVEGATYYVEVSAGFLGYLTSATTLAGSTGAHTETVSLSETAVIVRVQGEIDSPAPIEGAIVTIGGLSASTDASGTATITRVPTRDDPDGIPAELTVFVTGPSDPTVATTTRYQDASVGPVIVSETAITDLTASHPIALRNARLTVSVEGKDAAGAQTPVSEAIVTIGGPETVVLSTTDSGIAEFGDPASGAGLLVGDYLVSIVAEGYVTSADPTPVAVTSAAAASHTVILTEDVPPPQIGLSPTEGHVGDSITVTGTGFGPNATVAIDFGSAPSAATAMADSTGSFTAVFPFPAQPKGATTVTAHSSSATASGSFAVAESVSFLVNGLSVGLASSMFAVKVGDAVSVQGDGFAANTTVGVALGNGQTAGTPTSSLGSVERTFTVQDTSSHTAYQPTVGTFGTSADDDVDGFTVTPTISVTPNSARAGDDVVVAGHGFVEGLQVDIFIGHDSSGGDERAVDGSSISVDENGSFIATVKVSSDVVPNAISRVTADPVEHGFEILPSGGALTVRQGEEEVDAGVVGDLLTVSPTHATFGAGESVEVFFANQSITVLQAIDGTFTMDFAVPVTPGGTKQIRAVGVDTGETRTAPFDVVPTITSISQSQFGLDDTVTITGNGAGANDSLQVMLALAVDNSATEGPVADTAEPVTIIAGELVDTEGIYELTFRVDGRVFDTARAQVRLKVVSVGAAVESDWFGRDSDISGGLEVNTQSVWLAIDQASGAGDAVITVTGSATDSSGSALPHAGLGPVTLRHQFVAGGQDIVVSTEDLSVTVGAKDGDAIHADSSGNFAVSLPIGTAAEPKPGGILTVSIAGGRATYAIVPQLRVLGSDGLVTSQLELNHVYALGGTGYFPQQTVVVAFDGSTLETSSVTQTDEFGKFSTTFTIPPALGGPHSVSGADPFSATSTTLAVIGTITRPTDLLQAVVAGDAVDVVGIGFGANEELTFAVGPATIPTDDVVDGVSAMDGTFSASITIPAVDVGEHDLVVSSPSSSAILVDAFVVVPGTPDIEAVDIAIADVAIDGPQQISVAITITDVTGLGVDAVDLTLAYNPDVLTATGVSTTGTILSGWLATSSPTPGQVVVGMASPTPATGSGTLLYVQFDAHAPGTSALTLTQMALAEGVAPVSVQNGSVTVGSLISTSITVKTTPLGEATTVWNMIAPPVAPLSAVIDNTTFGELGDYAASNWLAFRWNPEQERYEQPDDVGGVATEGFEVGKSWFVAADDLEGDGDLTLTTTGTPTDTSTRAVIPISGNMQQPHWNMLGNPYNFAFAWTDATVQLRRVGDDTEYTPTQADGDQASDGGGLVDWIDNTAFTWDPIGEDWISGESDAETLVIAPGQGFFLLSSIEGELLLTPERAAPASPAASSAPIRPLAQVEWSIELVVDDGSARDSVTAAVASSLLVPARKGPPSPGRPSPRAVIKRHDSRESRPRYEYDSLYATLAPHVTWEVDVLAPHGGELRWRITGPVEGYDLTLQDQGTRRSIHMREHGYSALEATNGYRNFVLTARRRSTITQTRLLANYPNPFNPETWIPFELSQDADVVVSIYDLEGALVRTLHLGEKTVGRYRDRNRAAYWDGANEQGESAASGVYIYELHADDYREVRRMVIRK